MRLKDLCLGQSWPTRMGIVLARMHADRLGSHACRPSWFACMQTVLARMHADRLGSHACRPSWLACMQTVLARMHADRLGSHACRPSWLACMQTVLPHVYLNTMYTNHSILLPVLYCLICHLNNTIITSPIKFMIQTVI